MPQSSLEIKNSLEQYLQKMLSKLDAVSGFSPETRLWVIKKGRVHPHQVFEMMQVIEQGEEIRGRIKELGLSEAYAFNAAETAALLHDTGRLSEVDETSGKFRRAEEMIGTTHELESCKIAEALGVDDINILLPIKYHDAFYVEDKLNADDVFCNLNEAQKKEVLFFAHLLQDADRTANMQQYCKTGIKGTSETLDPAYNAKAVVTPEVKRTILKGKIPLKSTEKTYIDALLRFLSLSFTFHFEHSKKLFNEKIADGIFAHVKSEIAENAEDEKQFMTTLKDALAVYEFIKRKK